MEQGLTLHFIDGSKLSFDFPGQSLNAAARKLKLAEFLTSKHLVIEAEGSILIFPTANIKYIALTSTLDAKTARDPLPRHAITGARIRS